MMFNAATAGAKLMWVSAEAGAKVMQNAEGVLYAQNAAGKFSQLVGQSASVLDAVGGALPIASLGVGILNLGVSAYAAYKVHQVGKQVARLDFRVQQMMGQLEEVGATATENLHRTAHLQAFMETAVSHLDHVLHQQSLVMASVRAAQSETNDSLRALQEALATGFANVHAAMVDQEDRALEDRFRVTIRHYRGVLRALADGAPVPKEDVRRVVEECGKLAATLQGRIERAHPLLRAPLYVQRVLALRMEIDARLISDERNWAANVHNEDIQQIREAIRREVALLLDGASVWTAATIAAPSLTEYVFLDRALRGCIGIGSQEDDGLAVWCDATAATWDDGLEALRGAIVPSDSVPQLDTLRRRTLYNASRGLPATTPTPETLPLPPLRQLLGAPNDWMPDPDSVDGVLALARPNLMNDVRRRYVEAFA